MQQPLQRRRSPKSPKSTNASVPFASSLKLLPLHLTCGLGLASALWVAFSFYSLTFTQNPAQALSIVWIIEVSVVILACSVFRCNPDQCSYAKAVARGLLALPAGALLNAFGAIVLGAPLGIQHFTKTVHWSLLMSVFTFVPAASVYGTSWSDWHRIFAQTKPSGSIDFMICLPAHGSVIGAWFGAWPMPLDWERPWQDWPICVTYGAILGYLVGLVLSFGFIVFHNRRLNDKRD